MDPWFLPFSLWLCGLLAVLADYNITYDDTDPSITYSASEAWTRLKVSQARRLFRCNTGKKNLTAFIDLNSDLLG